MTEEQVVKLVNVKLDAIKEIVSNYLNENEVTNYSPLLSLTIDLSSDYQEMLLLVDEEHRTKENFFVIDAFRLNGEDYNNAKKRGENYGETNADE